jgi:hypothetical protein
VKFHTLLIEIFKKGVFICFSHLFFLSPLFISLIPRRAAGPSSSPYLSPPKSSPAVTLSLSLSLSPYGSTPAGIPSDSGMDLLSERATDGAVREIAEKWVLQRYKSFIFFLILDYISVFFC